MQVEVHLTSTTNNTLFFPVGLNFDSIGNLWVADAGNNRVLMYKADRRNPDLFYYNQPASLVIGQTNFTHIGVGTVMPDSFPDPPPRPPSPPYPIASPNSLNGPSGIAFDRLGNLWVADSGNHRILRYSKPFNNGQAASLVIGQHDYVG